jgi:hypothetical protein
MDHSKICFVFVSVSTLVSIAQASWRGLRHVKNVILAWRFPPTATFTILRIHVDVLELYLFINRYPYHIQTSIDSSTIAPNIEPRLTKGLMGPTFE